MIQRINNCKLLPLLGHASLPFLLGHMTLRSRDFFQVIELLKTFFIDREPTDFYCQKSHVLCNFTIIVCYIPT